MEKELEEERARAEDDEKQAKEAIEAKKKELHQIEAERQREVSAICRRGGGGGSRTSRLYMDESRVFLKAWIAHSSFGPPDRGIF